MTPRFALAAAGIMLLALGLRAHDLTLRAFHHDEAIHGYGSHQVAQVYRGHSHDHEYNPVYHGPLMYHVTGAAFALFGDSEATGRGVTVAFGLGLVALPLILRRELGAPASLMAALLLATSPLQIYFSRFLREDAFMAFFTAGFYGLFWRGKRDGRWLPGLSAVALLGFCFVTKESSYIVALVFASSVCIMGAFVVACRTGGLWGLFGLRARGAGGPRLVLGHAADVLALHPGMVQGLLALLGFALYCLAGALTFEWVWYLRGLTAAVITTAVCAAAAAHLVLVVRMRPEPEWDVVWTCIRGPLLGGVVFAAIFLCGFTNAFTFPGRLGAGLHSSLQYWVGQQQKPRLDGPFLYHAVLMLLHEPVVFLVPIAAALAAAGIVRRAAVAVAGALTLGVVLAGEHAWITGALDRGARALSGGRGPLDLLVAALLAWLFVRQAYRAHLARDTALAFTWLWALQAFLIYAWAREKVPWLTIHVAAPFSILTALLLRQASTLRRVAVLGLALVLAAHARWLVLRDGECNTADPITYVQTLPSVPRECARIEELLAGGRELLILNDVTVPFYWYFRHHRNLYSEVIGTPEPGQIVLTERGKEGGAAREGRRGRRIQFYVWHVPEWGSTGMGLEGLYEILEWLPSYLVRREPAPFRSGGMEALLIVPEEEPPAGQP